MCHSIRIISFAKLDDMGPTALEEVAVRYVTLDSGRAEAPAATYLALH